MYIPEKFLYYVMIELGRVFGFLSKFRFSEKATQIWRNLPLVLMLLSKRQKKVGDFFQILWPSHNIFTSQPR